MDGSAGNHDKFEQKVTKNKKRTLFSRSRVNRRRQGILLIAKDPARPSSFRNPHQVGIFWHVVCMNGRQ